MAMRTPAHELLRDAGARLHQSTTEEIFEFGLHEFILKVIGGIRHISQAIASDYRFTA